MQLEVGNIYEGKVTGITKFGAFVEFEGGKTGMVHISEVAPTFVKEITDHITQGQTVKVRVLNIAEDGKVSLSIKRAMDTPPPSAAPRTPRPPRPQFGSNDRRPPSSGGGGDRRPPSGGGGGGYAPRAPQQEGDKGFEDMLSKFMQKSDEKISDLKKTMDTGRRGYQKRPK